MDYAIDTLLDEDRCYAHLVDHSHGGKLTCPACGSSNNRVHHRRRKPVFQFFCLECRTYFNVFTGTAFEGTRWPCSKIVMIGLKLTKFLKVKLNLLGMDLLMPDCIIGHSTIGLIR
ncbi:MAG: transposase [Lewinellaceae bacterium]|nr:transposase [Lewinellaceae bacterium]